MDPPIGRPQGQPRAVVGRDEISLYVPPAGPVRLYAKDYTYDHNDPSSYLKDEPLERSFLSKDYFPSDGEFEVGDLVWAQVDRNPFWPAMVAAEPVGGTYHINKKGHQQFHVQYFGLEPKCGWVPSETVIPFRGYDQVAGQIQLYARIQAHGNGGGKQVPASKFTVRQYRLASWNYAIAEAQEALKMSKEARAELLTFNYATVGQQNERKLKLRPSIYVQHEVEGLKNPDYDPKE